MLELDCPCPYLYLSSFFLLVPCFLHSCVSCIITQLPSVTFICVLVTHSCLYSASHDLPLSCYSLILLHHSQSMFLFTHPLPHLSLFLLLFTPNICSSLTHPPLTLCLYSSLLLLIFHPYCVALYSSPSSSVAIPLVVHSQFVFLSYSPSFHTLFSSIVTHLSFILFHLCSSLLISLASLLSPDPTRTGGTWILSRSSGTTSRVASPSCR